MLPSSPLTPKEGEILSYLVEGFARNEIARALGVSEETVRYHARKVFSKFGGTNRRDTFRQLKEFYDLFVIGEHRLFYHRSKIVTLFLEDMQSNRSTKSSDVEVAYRDLTEDRLLLYSRDGTIDYANYNGRPMALEREINAKSTFVTKFSEPLKAGTKFFKEETAATRWDRTPKGSWNAEVVFPCAEYEFQLLFSPRNIPREIDMTILFKGQVLEKPPANVTAERIDVGYIVRAKAPKIGFSFRGTWVW